MLTHNSGFCQNEVESGRKAVLGCRWYHEYLYDVMQSSTAAMPFHSNVDFLMRQRGQVWFKLTKAIVYCIAVILDHLILCMCYCATSVCLNTVQRRMACIVSFPWLQDSYHSYHGYIVITMSLKQRSINVWHHSLLSFANWSSLALLSSSLSAISFPCSVQATFTYLPLHYIK